MHSHTSTPPRVARARATRMLLCAAMLAAIHVLVPAPAGAAEWHVRADGGDASQCSGAVDAPHDRASSGDAVQACAWSHPFIALPPGAAPRIAGGDTLVIHSGSYMMGLGAPGATPSVCHQSWSWDCYMAAVPSGPSPAQPTRVIGLGQPAPELWGTERSSVVLNLNGSSNVVVENLEITDHEGCIDQHCHGGACAGEVLRCNRDSAPWGAWAGTGVAARDSSNVVLRDINVHGMANRGVSAGRLRDWTMERVTIRGNGWAGWDGDIGGDSSNSGAIVFRELELAWNGCAERWPDASITGCWGQSAGGYGDGLGTGATGGHWLIEDSLIHHNTSDGLDLLYMHEGGSVTIRRTWAEGNAGNQLKTKGDARIENSVVVGNCSYFQDHGNMHPGDNCRALGNALSIGLGEDSIVELVNNTITGEGDCLVLSGGGGPGSRLELVNNVLLGQVDWRQPWEQTCAHYSDAGAERLSWVRNSVWSVKDGSCPEGSLCASPLLASAVMATFDPQPLPGSVLVDAGDAVLAPAHDHARRPRPSGSGPEIGAVESSQAAGAAPPADPGGPQHTPSSARDGARALAGVDGCRAPGAAARSRCQGNAMERPSAQVRPARASAGAVHPPLPRRREDCCH